MKQEEKDRMQTTLVGLTNALKADSANMKIIAILTAFFLPFTFVAVSDKLHFIFWHLMPDA
jgi:hypothetical protein